MLPREQILRALKAALEDVIPEVDGVPAWRVRHERFRDTSMEEMPCLAIRYIADDAPDVARPSDSGISISEDAFELRTEWVVDTPIPPEGIPAAGDLTEGEDPTGMGLASLIVETSLGALFVAGQEVNTLGGLIWDARYDGSGDNDELASPDNVRLAERVTLVYRVRSEAPQELLTGE